MIDRKVVQDIAKDYDLDKVKLGVVASHSALPFGRAESVFLPFLSQI